MMEQRVYEPHDTQLQVVRFEQLVLTSRISLIHQALTPIPSSPSICILVQPEKTTQELYNNAC